MPRVRATAGPAAASAYASPSKTTQMPLNDDREEKARRLQSRQALHVKQMDQLKAAASPHKRRSLAGEGTVTPSRQADEDDMYGVRGDHITPMKRMPILANFEEWMKMATDNKINAANSWNFALIDYFHDMSLLREGDGVNFQKASCTLDGCVKIYTSRVDSVATETGKLLSGLADSGNKKRKGETGDDAGEDDGEDGAEGDEEGGKKKGKRKAQRSAEATLVSSFDQLRLKKMELEFAVDPLFKKASADFDEGGASGLLLNHLSIDNTGRIVFDSSDDAEEDAQGESRRDSMEPDAERDDIKESEMVEEDGPVDLESLGARFFPDLDMLEAKDVCPSLKTFELGGGDGSLELPFLKAPDNWRDEGAQGKDGDALDAAFDDNAGGFDMDDDDSGPGGFDLPPTTGFGEGGEAWARDAALQPQLRVYDASGNGDSHDDAAGEVGVFDTNSNTFGVTLQHRPDRDQENILNYFDNALQKNWAGPEHWKIARIKEANKPQPVRTRKEKEPFEIDFAAPMSQELATALYTHAPNNSTITLPKKDRRSRTRNLLPDDKHFNSKDLLKLFLKPKARLGARKSEGRGQDPDALPNGEIDEAWWAAHAGPENKPFANEAAAQGDYDANFFQDDGLPMLGAMDDDDTFADARENFSPEIDLAGSGPTGAGIDSIMAAGDGDGAAFGANLVAQSRRTRPEYVQYARVAKKVDMRRLKHEMWRGIGFDVRYAPPPSLPPLELSLTPPGSASDPPSTPARAPPAPSLALDDKQTLRFTDIMNNLQHVYPRQQMSDISTSYGFICLLHLANEKGLVIENVNGWQDLTVRKDFHAVDLDAGD
ncbi:hypothetical protein MRB53_039112 [Persea americana]|nr:hypothetical protein MRB53_039112 [Persea americana]